MDKIYSPLPGKGLKRSGLYSFCRAAHNSKPGISV